MPKRHLKRLLELFDTKTLAQEAGVTPSTIRRWAKRKKLTVNQQDTIERLWKDRGNIATDYLIDASSEYSSIKFLVGRGTVPKRYLTAAQKKLKLAQKTSRLAKPTLRQELAKHKKRNRLSTSTAQALAESHGYSVRQVFTFFYYL